MSERALAVVVLAAGQGTRMKSARPKVLHQVSGRSLLGHTMAAAGDLRPVHVVVVVRHERDLVVADLDESTPGLVVVDQDEIPGTGRAVQLAVAALPADFDGDVVVLSGDVLLLESALIAQLVAEHRSAGAAASLLSTVPPEPTGFGRIVRGPDGSVDRIVEEADADDEIRAIPEINAGTYVFEAAALRAALPGLGSGNAQGEVYLTDAIAAIRAGGRTVAASLAPHGFIHGINDRAQLAAAERALNARIVRWHQLNGVTVRDPETTWIDFDVTIGADTELLPGTQLRGATSIGGGAVIGPDTTLTDTEVGDAATVERAVANLAVIGAGTTVGPFAYLRPGARLETGSKVGTFVEVKNSVVGRGSKVPHLSYIGDTDIGEDTNLGASTITANYDGRRKHRTTIGSRVHTAIHSSLVAPVSVGDDATLAAGAVIRKDVPPGALGMTVAPQRNVEGWVPAAERGDQSE